MTATETIHALEREKAILRREVFDYSDEIIRLRAELTKAREWLTENQAIADLRKENEWLRNNSDKVSNFLSAVIRMRAAQKEYFKTSEREDLIESKRLESQVDQMAREFSKQDCEGI